MGHSDEAREILEGLLVGTLKRQVRTFPPTPSIMSSSSYSHYARVSLDCPSVAHDDGWGPTGSRNHSAYMHSTDNTTPQQPRSAHPYPNHLFKTFLTTPPGGRPQTQVLLPSHQEHIDHGRRLRGRRPLRRRPHRRRPRLRRLPVPAGPAGAAVNASPSSFRIIMGGKRGVEGNGNGRMRHGKARSQHHGGRMCHHCIDRWILRGWV